MEAADEDGSQYNDQEEEEDDVEEMVQLLVG